jgi:dihydroorotase/N-acyl-D-amino-acid deacylase
MTIRYGIALLLGLVTTSSCASGDRFDLIVANGWIVDGTGNPQRRGDIGVRGDRIVVIGDLASHAARRRIDATGLTVTPGFIDMLGWSDLKILADNRALSKVTQGITTEVTGEGSSVAPQTAATIADNADYHASIGVDVTWHDLDGYFQAFEDAGSTINLATFVGATQVRKVVLGREDRAPSASELERMVALVDTAMMQGALGLSSSLVYAPASFADTDELIALARAARRHGGMYATHLRNEGAGFDAAFDEALSIAVAADIPVEIWHLKRAGQESWGDMPRALARIDSARAEGIDITADVYPYQASATGLSASIPTWAHEGGTDSLLARLQDPATRRRIRGELTDGGRAESFFRGAGGPGGVLIAGVLADSLQYVDGKSIASLAAAWAMDPIDALFELIIRDRANTGAIYFSMHEEDVRTAVAYPWTSFCTDYGAVAPDGPLSGERVHPRVYGSFPRVLGRYVREHRLLRLEEAIRKMTSQPAQRVGLSDRGLLRAGMAADIVIFDAGTIGDLATFEDPHRLSRGVQYVIVNGAVVLDDGMLTDGRPGRVLRGPGWQPPLE